jgi:hypothetical protein
MLIARLAPAARATRAPAQPGELRYSVANITAARSALGYQPTRSLEVDLDDVVSDIRGR